MSFTRLQKIALAVAGATSLGIGATIVGAPHVFYASYDIAIGTDPSLLSEVRAFGAGLTGFGAVMLAGIIWPPLRQTAIVSAHVVFLAFPAGRLVSLVADGVPSTGILSALGLELAIAALCLFAFRRRTTTPARMAVS